MEVSRFLINVPESSLIDLQERLMYTRWPDELIHSGWEYGTNLAYLKELTRYWQYDYNWRVNERWLNEWPHYKVMIDSQEIHFIHIAKHDPVCVDHPFFCPCEFESIHVIIAEQNTCICFGSGIAKEKLFAVGTIVAIHIAVLFLSYLIAIDRVSLVECKV